MRHHSLLVGSCSMAQLGALRWRRWEKNIPANAGGEGGRFRGRVLIPGSGRFPGVGSGHPLRYSCLENSLGRGVWWATIRGATKSQTWLSQWAHTIHSWFPSLYSRNQQNTVKQLYSNLKKCFKNGFNLYLSVLPPSGTGLLLIGHELKPKLTAHTHSSLRLD